MIILLCGAVIYLAVLFIFGTYGEKTAMVSRRLLGIEKMGEFDESEADSLEQPFLERFFKPGVSKLMGYLGSILPMNATSIKALNEQLRQSGSRQSAQEYVAIHITILGLSTVGAFILSRIISLGSMQLLYFIVVLLCSIYVISRFRLSSRITQRKNQIENDMPDVLDLLSVSVAAGLGFDQALLYVTERCKGPLVEELTITQKEIALGRARGDALKQLAERCDVQPLSIFVSAIIQAETLGIPIANVLKTQADNIRSLHREKIEEKAAKLPVKILIPLVLLVFPNLFVIILGPAVPRIFAAFSGG